MNLDRYNLPRCPGCGQPLSVAHAETLRIESLSAAASREQLLDAGRALIKQTGRECPNFFSRALAQADASWSVPAKLDDVAARLRALPFERGPNNDNFFRNALGYFVALWSSPAPQAASNFVALVGLMERVAPGSRRVAVTWLDKQVLGTAACPHGAPLAADSADLPAAWRTLLVHEGAHGLLDHLQAHLDAGAEMPNPWERLRGSIVWVGAHRNARREIHLRVAFAKSAQSRVLYLDLKAPEPPAPSAVRGYTLPPSLQLFFQYASRFRLFSDNNDTQHGGPWLDAVRDDPDYPHLEAAANATVSLYPYNGDVYFLDLDSVAGGEPDIVRIDHDDSASDPHTLPRWHGGFLRFVATIVADHLK